MKPLFSPSPARLRHAVLLLAMLMPALAQAEAGHDHGAAPTASSAAALPRFAASSELFELVGVVNGTALTLYLDHAPDNRPVKDARLEVELGGQRLTLTPHGDGEFEAALASALPAGVTPVTATVVTSDASDLLAGELDVHADAHAEPSTAPDLRRIALWGGGAVAVLALFAVLARRLLAARPPRMGGAA